MSSVLALKNNNLDPSGNQYKIIDNNPYAIAPKRSTKISIGMVMLYVFIYLICVMLLPSCILFFITRWSAKSALKSTPCGNPDLLKSLLQTPSA